MVRRRLVRQAAVRRVAVAIAGLEAGESLVCLTDGSAIGGVRPSGAGEPAIAPRLAALVNAVFAAIGTRHRRLKIRSCPKLS
jgi:hypothetical protein